MNMYWYKAAADAHWNTPGNWWSDHTSLGAGHTNVAAGRIPTTNDAVYLLGATAPDTDPSAVTLMVFDTSGLMTGSYYATGMITIASGGTLVMGLLDGPGNYHAWFGDANSAGSITFNDETSSGGQLGDYAVFNDSSTNCNGGGGICGRYARFNDASYTGVGSMQGLGDYATFNNTGPNEGDFYGTTYYIEGSNVDLLGMDYAAGGDVTLYLTKPDANVKTPTAFSCDVMIMAQADLTAPNILTGKTILGVPGSHPTVAETLASVKGVVLNI